MKSITVLVVGLFFTITAAAIRADEIPVVISGTPIPEKVLLAEIDGRINAQAAAGAQKGLAYDESSRASTRAYMRAGVLHMLIERQLIADQLKLDHREITDADVDARFIQETQSHHQTPQAAEQTILQQGQTVQQIKEGLRQTMGVERLYQLHAPDPSDPTDASAKEFYDANPHYFDQPEQRRVSRILIRVAPDAGVMMQTSAQTRAEQIRQKLSAGEGFATLAKASSEDDATKQRGGDRGWSPRGWVSSPDADPFGNVAFALKQVGDVSAVTRTQDGYDIVQLTGIKPARLPPFDEVKASILQQFRSRNIGAFWETYGNALWTRADIHWSTEELARQKEQDQREQAYVKKMDEQNGRIAGN